MVTNTFYKMAMSGILPFFYGKQQVNRNVGAWAKGDGGNVQREIQELLESSVELFVENCFCLQYVFKN